MTRHAQRLIVAVVLLAPGFAVDARAQAGIGFLQNPTKTTITAGNAFAGFEKGMDWIAPKTLSATGHPEVNDPQEIDVTTWRDSTGLFFTFSVQDQTRVQWGPTPNVPPDGTTLGVGDTIVIVVDPNNSRNTTLQNTGGAATDYRFDVMIQDNQITTEGSVPQDGLGGWDNSSLTSMPNLATLTSAGGDRYTVDVFIPFTALGGAITGDFGVAFAVINDLGHGTGSPKVYDLWGTWFPHNMCLDDPCDPGFVTLGGTATGNWTNPSQWGTGFFATTPGGISITHNPSYVFSDGIKISVCSAPTWASVPNSGNWGPQLSLTNWYQWYGGNPCRMKVWVKVDKSTAGAENSRIFVVWGRSNIGGTQDWFPVGLSPVVPIASPSHISFMMWDDPPPQNFTDHPCLKVYVLPATLHPNWTEAKILAIKTQTDLQNFQNDFGLNGYHPLTAQMNFTALRTGNCATMGCNSLTSIITRPFQWIAGLFRGGESDGTRAALADAQPPQPRRPDIIKEPAEIPHRDRPFATNYYRVTAVGVGVTPTTNPKKRYRFLQNLGGVAWAVPHEQLTAQGTVTLGFDLQNPTLIAPVMLKGKQVDAIKSPAREAYVSVVITAPKRRVWWNPFIQRDFPHPKKSIETPRGRMEPGRPARATLTLTSVER